MPFGLINAPTTTFCTLMNQVFHEYVDKFFVACLDDIVVYSSMTEKYKHYLQMVLSEIEGKPVICQERKILLRETTDKLFRPYDRVWANWYGRREVCYNT